GHEAGAGDGARDRRRPGQGVLREGRLRRRPRPDGERGGPLRAAHPARVRLLHRGRPGPDADGARIPRQPADGGRGRRRDVRRPALARRRGDGRRRARLGPLRRLHRPRRKPLGPPAAARLVRL
ncbi:MAG: Lyase, partial [uncultured Nocardioides sp.]